MSTRAHTLGVDIGGTKIAAAVVSSDGEPLGLTRASTPAQHGAEAILNAALETARNALAGYPHLVASCGIGTAGTVGADGVITHATEALAGWTGTNVRHAFGEALQMPTTVLNDVHAATIGEGLYGAASGYTDVLVVAVGTGIGGGILHGGQLIRGRTGSAGAIGHLPVAGAKPRRCPCGGQDHLEAYAAGPAIEARYLEATGRSDRLPTIAAKARAGDEAALSIIVESAEILGRALGAIANILDPDVIVIAGGVAALEDLIAAPMHRALVARALPGPDRTELRFSTLRGTATVLGAAAVARRNMPGPREGRFKQIDLPG
jgi:glucokinase